MPTHTSMADREHRTAGVAIFAVFVSNAKERAVATVLGTLGRRRARRAAVRAIDEDMMGFKL